MEIKKFKKFTLSKNINEKIDNLKMLNELFDDTVIRDRNIIPYLTKNIDKKEISKVEKSNMNSLNKTIVDIIPFYEKGSPEVFPNMIIYTFGDLKNKLVVVIDGGELKNEKNDVFNIRLYVEKNGICLNPNQVGDVFDKYDLLIYLEELVIPIKREFVIKPVIHN